MISSLKNPANHYFLFFFVLLFSFLVRLITLGSYETWNDEKISVNESNGLLNYHFQAGTVFTNQELEKHNTFYNVIQSTIQGDGGNGIVYILSLHCWSELFGNSDFGVRFFSLLCGIGAIILIYLLTLELFGHKIMALITMFLAGIHPHLITYSQEARTYSLTLFFTLAASLLLFRMGKENAFKSKHLLLYALLVAAGFLSHYSSVYIFIGHFFILIFFFRINLKNGIRLSVFMLLPALIVFLWFYYFGLEGLGIIAGRNQNYIQLSIKDPTNTFYMKTSAYSIAAGWFQNVLMFFGNTFVNLGLRIIILLPLLIIPFFLIFSGLKIRELNQQRELKMLSILSISSLLYATILGLTAGHVISFQQLYSTFSAPYVIIILGYCIFRIISFEHHPKQYMLNTLMGLQLIIMLFSTTLIYFGLDSNTKNSNQFETLAQEIKTIHSDQHTDFTIVYSNANTAMELNKQLHSSLKEIKQVIDTTTMSPTLYLKFQSAQKQYVLIK